jgi:hypothetical protein
MRTNDGRLAGWLASAGGLCHAAVFATFGLMLTGAVPALAFLDEQHWLAHLLEVPGMALLALGIAGIYRHHRGATGWLGLAGACLGAVGLGTEAAAGAFIAVAEPLTGLDTRSDAWMPPTHLPGLVGIAFGSLLLGIAMARARVLPRRATVPLATAAVAFFALMVAPVGEAARLALPALLSLGWAWVGYTVVAGPARRAARRALAAA